jgi:hypothetical protein
MTTQTLTTSANLLRLAFALPIAKMMQATPCDYGFDFNEDELGRELLAPLPTSLASQSFHELNADELEKTYFLS